MEQINLKNGIAELIKKLENEKEPANGDDWVSGYNNGLTRAITLLCELYRKQGKS